MIIIDSDIQNVFQKMVIAIETSKRCLYKKFPIRASISGRDEKQNETQANKH